MVALTVILAVLVVNVLIAWKGGHGLLISQAATMDASLAVAASRPWIIDFAHMSLDLRLLLIPAMAAWALCTLVPLVFRQNQAAGIVRKLVWHNIVILGLCAFLFILVVYSDSH